VRERRAVEEERQEDGGRGREGRSECLIRLITHEKRVSPTHGDCCHQACPPSSLVGPFRRWFIGIPTAAEVVPPLRVRSLSPPSCHGPASY